MLERVSSEIPSSIVADIVFIGRGGGAVKTLGGFQKGRHAVPDAANATTNAFLGKICAAELAEEAEKLFQEARTAFAYRRKDLSLTVGSPVAVLTAKDFTVEIEYALEERDPGRYAVTTSLRGLRDGGLARQEAMAAVFGGKFGEISFGLRKGASVEAVIDAIEEVGPERGMTVAYPSDCRECTIRVDGVDAAVRCTGATLEVVFARTGAPGELIDGFATVREAFAISAVLAGLIG